MRLRTRRPGASRQARVLRAGIALLYERMTTTPTSDARLEALRQWLTRLPAEHALDGASIRPASNDASFRRYFRIDAHAPGRPRSFVLMDAPPPMEDCRPFVHAAQVLIDAGMHAPRVFAADLELGFLMLEDFGQRTYLEELNALSAPSLYGDATGALVRLQLASRPAVFPDYDDALLRRELMLYPDWYLAQHKRQTLSDDDRNTLAQAFERLLANNLGQPRVYVHRDYHSRNLMILDGADNPGVIDFQDAVYGPITYDLVSLLRDAYVRWEEEQVLDWVIRYWEKARKAGLPVAAEFGDFYRDFEWMGLQRHLKVLGIFARLNYRDGKDRYLNDLPLVLDYVLKAASRYRAFDPLVALIDRVESRERSSGHTF